MPDKVSRSRSWWKLVLTGLLAFAFGLAAIALPARIMFEGILDLIFGKVKPQSGGMSVVAILLALVALVAVDGLLNLFGTGTTAKGATRLRGVVGIAVAIAAVFWPGITAYVAVELIGLWVVLVGVLELIFVKDSSADAKDRTLLIIAGTAAIVIGIGMMRWVFTGAVLVSALVGIAAAARGVSLIMSGVRERAHQFDERRNLATGGRAA
jgi:uncharacterized membrane protein HdeD (DUF308 family)